MSPPADEPDEGKERKARGYALGQGAPCTAAGSGRTGHGNWGREHIDTSGRENRAGAEKAGASPDRHPRDNANPRAYP
jgi:hypothetical protein